MTGPQHKAIGVAVAAAAAPLVGLSGLVTLVAALLFAWWPRRLRGQVVVLGAFVAFAISQGSAPGTLLVFLGIAVLSALVPDIDHRFSTVSKALPPGYWVFRWFFSNPLTWLVFGRARMQALVRHRMVSHTVWAWLLWMGVVGWGLWWLVGVLWSHPMGHLAWTWVVGDLPVTWSSVPVLWRLPLLGVTAAGLGMGSHLLADAATRSKLRPLVPLSDWQFQLLPDALLLRTGGR